MSGRPITRTLRRAEPIGRLRSFHRYGEMW